MKRSLMALAATFAVGAAGCALPPLADEPAMRVGPISVERGQQRAVDNVVIVTDGSGTTYADKTFPKAKSLSQAAASALPETSAAAKSSAYNAGNIGFGGNERVGHPLASFNRSALEAGVGRTRNLGRVGGGGGETPIHRVLDEIGTQLQGKTGKAAVLLFSDGDVHCPSLSIDAARALAKSHGSDVCIHTVQVGDRAGGDAFLRELAAAGSRCGSYRTAADVSSASSMSSFVHAVMVEGAAAPAPKAAPPPPPPPKGPDACAGMVLEGVEFATNSADLIGRSAAVLDSAAAQLRSCTQVNVQVEGHTDSRGADSYNQSLSERRASSVLRYLEAAGVSGSRLSSVGVGEASPIGSNDTAEGRQRNRRVELRPR